MTRNISLRFTAAVALFVSCASLGLGQTSTVSSTTLSAAATATARTISVAAATGITARTRAEARGGVGSSTANNLTILYVDREAMEVEGVSSTTITVRRGAHGTTPTSHASSAKVWLGRAGYFGAADKSGPCTTASESFLPVFNIHTGKRFNCDNTNWFEETLPSSLISANCSGTVGSAETAYLNDAACSAATTVTARRVITSAGTVANLRVYSSAVAVGGTNKDVLTVMKNGSDTTLTCTIAAAAATCSDTTHKVAVAAGDVLTFKFVTASSDTAADISVGIEKYQLQ